MQGTMYSSLPDAVKQAASSHTDVSQQLSDLSQVEEARVASYQTPAGLPESC